MPKTHTVYDDPDTDRQFEVFQSEPKSVLWMAEEDGVVLGSCGVFPTDGLPKGWCEIVKFHMDKRARGKGIGSLLFEKALVSAQEFDYSTASLRLSRNSAVLSECTNGTASTANNGDITLVDDKVTEVTKK